MSARANPRSISSTGSRAGTAAAREGRGGVLAPSLGAPDSWYELLSNPILSLAGVLVPLSVGIAILRYRLWDIDVLINRALVYASLTALLAGLYVGLILALQALVRALTTPCEEVPSPTLLFHSGLIFDR